MLAPSSSPGREGGSNTHRSRKTAKTPPGMAASTHQDGSDTESVSSAMGNTGPNNGGSKSNEAVSLPASTVTVRLWPQQIQVVAQVRMLAACMGLYRAVPVKTAGV